MHYDRVYCLAEMLSPYSLDAFSRYLCWRTNEYPFIKSQLISPSPSQSNSEQILHPLQARPDNSASRISPHPDNSERVPPFFHHFFQFPTVPHPPRK